MNDQLRSISHNLTLSHIWNDVAVEILELEPFKQMRQFTESWFCYFISQR